MIAIRLEAGHSWSLICLLLPVPRSQSLRPGLVGHPFREVRSHVATMDSANRGRVGQFQSDFPSASILRAHVRSMVMSLHYMANTRRGEHYGEEASRAAHYKLVHKRRLAILSCL